MLLGDARKFAGRAVLSVIIVLAGFSVFFPSDTQPMPGNLIFELLLFAVIIANGATLSRKLAILTFSIVLYLGYCLVVSVLINETNTLDALLALKFLGYLAMLSVYRRSALFKLRDISVFTDVLLILFFLKYAIAQLGGFNPRPGVFYENNFELLFLLLLVGFLAGTTERGNWFRYCGMAAIVVLSGSRFGFFALAVMLMFAAHHRWPSIGYTKRLLLFALILFGSVAILFGLLKLRPDVANLDNLDRLRFLEVFIGDIQEWGAIEWLTGSPPLTPLSSYACSALSFYESLFSMSGDGSCYAVILHSMIIRVVFDHGLLGLLLLGLSLYWIINSKGIDRTTTLMIVALLAANSLSVSSVNSPFSILAICIIISCKTRNDFLVHQKTTLPEGLNRA